MPAARWLVPEVVQTSAMDCGPAALKAVLEGFGISASYGRLREACQTDVDGTSIDTVEDALLQLGVSAEQVVVPLDHVLLREADVLPAIVTRWTPGRLTHFAVAWRRHGRFVQVMDPAAGRQWPSLRQFGRDLYVHEQELSAAEWLAWASSDDFLRPLHNRLRRLGLTTADADAAIDRALTRPGWRPLAELDAIHRMLAGLVAGGAMRRGSPARRALDTFVAQAAERPDSVDDIVPAAHWSARPAARDPAARVRLRGALLIIVRPGRSRERTPVKDACPPPRSPELAAALTEPAARPAKDVLRLIRSDGVLPLTILAGGAGLGAATVMLEAVIFRTFIELGPQLALVRDRWAILGIVTSFLLAAGLLDLAVGMGLLRSGRRLEVRLRAGVMRKIPRLGDRYFRSRLTSDMAERSHSIHGIRQLPLIAARFLRAGTEMTITVGGLIWLDPAAAPVAIGTAVTVIGAALAVQPWLAERDLRFRTHRGALVRFALDASLGLTAIRAHGAERAIRRQHEALLAEWGRAGLALLDVESLLTGIQSAVSLGAMIWLLWDHMLRVGVSPSLLLLAYWCTRLPSLADEITTLARQYPSRRNLTLRLVEPLGARDEIEKTEDASVPHGEDPHRGVGVQVTFQSAAVHASGRTVLRGLDFDVRPGEHIAIVGVSGAGKSTLVGVLLGWSKIAEGQVRVDGRTIDTDALADLRRCTAWVDPAVQVWNRSLLDNLAYGTMNASSVLSEVVAWAELQPLLSGLQNGFRTPLGEGGGLVSGGEGQRVRFGRALARAATRLVILDEPFRGLDRQLRCELLARARNAWARATLLCVTHDIAETSAFDRVLVVEAGTIVEDGAPAVLAMRPGSHYRSLLDAEAHLHREFWRDSRWRRVWLDGALQTAPDGPGV